MRSSGPACQADRGPNDCTDHDCRDCHRQKSPTSWRSRSGGVLIAFRQRRDRLRVMHDSFGVRSRGRVVHDSVIPGSRPFTHEVNPWRSCSKRRAGTPTPVTGARARVAARARTLNRTTRRSSLTRGLCRPEQKRERTSERPKVLPRTTWRVPGAVSKRNQRATRESRPVARAGCALERLLPVLALRVSVTRHRPLDPCGETGRASPPRDPAEPLYTTRRNGPDDALAIYKRWLVEPRAPVVRTLPRTTRTTWLRSSDASCLR
jgi:hypothetical protein